MEAAERSAREKERFEAELRVKIINFSKKFLKIKN